MRFCDPSYEGATGRAMESACAALGIHYPWLLERLHDGWDGRGIINTFRRSRRKAKAEAA